MKQREAANGGIPRKSVSICLCVFLLPLHLQRLLLPQVADDQQARHFNLFRDYSTDGQEALLITSNSSVVKTTPFVQFVADR